MLYNIIAHSLMKNLVTLTLIDRKCLKKTWQTALTISIDNSDTIANSIFNTDFEMLNTNVNDARALEIPT